LRETDLWDFQRQLDRIDEARVDGNFLDALGRPAEIYEQRVSCVWLSSEDLRTDRLVDATIPAPQELCVDLPTTTDVGASLGSSAPNLQSANDSTEMPAGGEEAWWRFVATRTLPVQHEGTHTYETPYCPLLIMWQLNSIDNMRKDGKFMVGDEIPDGQGRVTQLLEDCFELAYELRNDAEDDSSADVTPQNEGANDPVAA
jgi:hypothetical protein